MMKSKRGAVEWTVGKLMSIVLLVIFLALVVYGISVNGFNPLFERAGGMVDSVLLLFHIGGDGSESRDCIEIDGKVIEGVGVGKLIKCMDYCEIEFEEGVDLVGYNEKTKEIISDVSSNKFRLRYYNNDLEFFYDNIYLSTKYNEVDAFKAELYKKFFGALKKKSDDIFLYSSYKEIYPDFYDDVEDDVIYFQVYEYPEDILLRRKTFLKMEYSSDDSFDYFKTYSFSEDASWSEVKESYFKNLILYSRDEYQKGTFWSYGFDFNKDSLMVPEDVAFGSWFYHRQEEIKGRTELIDSVESFIRENVKVDLDEMYSLDIAEAHNRRVIYFINDGEKYGLMNYGSNDIDVWRLVFGDNFKTIDNSLFYYNFPDEVYNSWKQIGEINSFLEDACR